MNVTPNPLSLIFESEKRFFRGVEIKDYGKVENLVLEGFRFEQTDFLNGGFEKITFSSFFFLSVYFSNS